MAETEKTEAESASHPGGQNAQWKETDQNAAPSSRASNGQSEAHEQDPMLRADEMVDHLAESVGHYTSIVGKKLLRVVARAREEAEDMWAEAQNLRHGPRG